MNGRSPVWAFALALVGALVPPKHARADIALHDGGAEADRDVTAMVKARTGKAPSAVLSSDVLAGPTRALVANADVERCEGDPQSTDAGKRLDAIRDAVLSFDLARAEQEIAAVRSVLPCAKALVGPDQLATLWFYAGAARLDQGDEAGGRKAMALALAASPNFEGPKGFPKTHVDLLTSVRTAGAPAASPFFVWTGRTAAEVFIDGVAAPQASTAGRVLPAGPHLVQLRWEDHQVGLWVTTTGATGALVEPASGRAIWADGGRSPGGELAMRLLLADEFQGREGDVHIVQFRRGRPAGATWSAAGGARVVWDEQPAGREGRPVPSATSTPPASTTARPITKNAEKTKERRLRLAVGGGWMYAEPFHYAAIAADLSVRPIGPLVVSVFVRSGYGGDFDYPVAAGEDPVGGPVFFTPVGVAAGVQRPGDIAPFVQGAFQFAYNRDGLSAGVRLFGALVQGGIDLSPKDSPFLARIGAEVGVVGDGDDKPAALTSRLWAGVGARF